MSKFEVGDKLRRIEPPPSYSAIPNKATCRVFNPNSSYVCVKWDRNEYDCGQQDGAYNYEDFELIESEKVEEFQVGQRLRLIKAGNAAKIGATCVVTESLDESGFITVIWDRNKLWNNQSDGKYCPASFELFSVDLDSIKAGDKLTLKVDVDVDVDSKGVRFINLPVGGWEFAVYLDTTLHSQYQIIDHKPAAVVWQAGNKFTSKIHIEPCEILFIDDKHVLIDHGCGIRILKDRREFDKCNPKKV